MSFYEWATLGLGLLSLGLLYTQIRQAAKALTLDHERSRNEATIQFMLQIRALWHESRRRLEEKWGASPLSEAALAEIETDPEAHEAVRTLLGHLELLAVGVNADVYNYSLLRRMSGAHLCSMYDRLAPYIKKAQAKLPTAYVEFEQLAKRVRASAAAGRP